MFYVFYPERRMAKQRIKENQELSNRFRDLDIKKDGKSQKKHRELRHSGVPASLPHPPEVMLWVKEESINSRQVSEGQEEIMLLSCEEHLWSREIHQSRNNPLDYPGIQLCHGHADFSTAQHGRGGGPLLMGGSGFPGDQQGLMTQGHMSAK